MCTTIYNINSKLHCQQKYRQFDLSVIWSTVFQGGRVQVRTSLLIPQGAIMDRELDPKLLKQIGFRHLVSWIFSDSGPTNGEKSCVQNFRG
jgi:hypothetical protein